MNRLVLTESSFRECSKDAAETKLAWLITESLEDYTRNEAVTPDAGETFVAVRLHLSGRKGDDNPGASDPDGKVRFTLGNIRLVGFRGDDRREDGCSRYPLGILKPGWKMLDRVGLDGGREYGGSGGMVDLVFSWPAKLKETPPWFVEFKRSSRANMPVVQQLQDTQPEAKDVFGASVGADKGEFVRISSSAPYVITGLTVLSTDGQQDSGKMLVAADSGVLPLDDDCISIARPWEASNCPHAAMVLRPAKTRDIFSNTLRVKDLVLVPGPKDHWFDNGPLWVG